MSSGHKLTAAQIHFRDQIKLAHDYAHRAAKANNYKWSRWLNEYGMCTAGFEREGSFWSLSFTWQPAEGLEQLKFHIDRMNYAMVACQKEFGAMKLGASMANAGHTLESAGAMQ